MATKPVHKKGERWGKKREDKRNWNTYNEELVVRGKLLLDLNWVKSWVQELKEMNEGKRGRPYKFPESLIEQQAIWNQWVGVRGVEGITRQLVEIASLPDFNDYSTINRRIREIEPCFELPRNGFCSASTDRSGMKMHNAGEYRQIKYGAKQKKWICVTITANPLTKDLLDLDVSIEGDAEPEYKIATQHMNNLWNRGITIDKFWGDGAYDVITHPITQMEACAEHEKWQSTKEKLGTSGLKTSNTAYVGLAQKAYFHQSKAFSASTHEPKQPKTPAAKRLGNSGRMKI